MIDHLLFYKLKPEVDDAVIEEMIRTSRSLLLKVPPVLSVRTGRTVDPKSDWPFYILLEFESREKKRICQDDANYLKFLKVVIEPHTSTSYSIDYETDPSKDLKYS
ncbi:MAG: Dabb family protein [Verrucomicrobiaceae bacterium]